jgi:hypothetical protein
VVDGNIVAAPDMQHERNLALSEPPESFLGERETEIATRKLRSEHPYVVDLIGVLRAHPGGLRRWSVMRAMRNRRKDAAGPIPQKFEDEVERVFRRWCGDADKTQDCAEITALFYRPGERAGEVWAVFRDRAEAWLKAERLDDAL